MPFRLVLLAVVLVCSSTAHAQAVPGDTTRVDDLIVTATRSEILRRAVPATVSTITGDELRARGIRFVADWLLEVPGTTVVPTGSYGGVTSLFLRGGESDYTKILIDGVAANLPGGSIDLANLTTDNIERIEVLRGPASVLYGSDAMTGVIQILTRRGGGPGVVRGTVRVGTQSTTDITTGYERGVGRVRWTGSVSRFGSDGFYGFNNGYTSVVGSARVSAELDPATRAVLTLRYGDHKAHFPTDYAGVPSDSNQFNTERGLTAALEAGRVWSTRVATQVTGSVFRGRFGFGDLPDGAADTLGFGYAAERDSRITRSTIDVRTTVDLSRRFWLAGGIEVGRESEEQSSSTTSNFGGGRTTDVNDFDRDRSNRAGYLQVRGDLPREIGLHAGLRFDDNDVFGTFTTWQAGVVVLPSSTLRVHASTGSAFKQPTFSEQFANTPFEIGNPDLRPEHAFTWEVGIEESLVRGRVTLSATWFDQQFNDLIEYVSAAENQPTYANLTHASSTGAEIGVRLSPVSSVQVGLSSTWLRTRVAGQGDQLLRRPSRNLSASLSWRPRRGTLLATDLVWTGSRDDMDFNVFPAERVTLPSYSIVNGSVDLPLGGVGPWHAPGGLAVTGRVENVFGTSYQTVVGFPGRGRTLLMGLRIGR